MPIKPIQAWSGVAVLAVSFAGAVGLLVLFARKRTMHVQERQAWFMLGVFAMIAAGYLLLTTVIRLPWESSLCVMGVFGVAGLAGMIGRGERRQGRVVMDERDREIQMGASLIGFSVFWVVFVIACMAPFFGNGPNATVTLRTTTLTWPPILGMILVFTVKSLAVVLMYRRSGHGQAD